MTVDSMALTFRDILTCVGIDPGTTRLARHQDPRSATGRTLFELWLHDRDKFEAYQRVQAKRRFDRAKHLAAFVVTPGDDTLFVGLYAVVGCDAPKERQCPVSERWLPLYEYALDFSPVLSEYCGRITIAWTGGPRNWCQRADRTPKPLVEMRRTAYDYEPFPGFDAFSVNRSRFGLLPLAWREVLRANCGVYLLVHPTSGEQYVGSAYGEQGFLGRFATSARDGHGGNTLLMQHRAVDWRMSVLEVASSNSDVEAILARESHWKNKLGTRAHTLGLNAN